jgi:hypothetical protein
MHDLSVLITYSYSSHICLMGKKDNNTQIQER